jgi:hypothetical protein
MVLWLNRELSYDGRSTASRSRFFCGLERLRCVRRGSRSLYHRIRNVEEACFKLLVTGSAVEKGSLARKEEYLLAPKILEKSDMNEVSLRVVEEANNLGRWRLG